MKPTEAMSQIESPEFTALVNVASSYKVFLRLLTAHDALKSLLQATNQANVVDKIAARVKELIGIEPQDALEHSHDAALAAYVWLLGEKSPRHAIIAADLIGKGKNLLWARRVAEKLAHPKASVSVLSPESLVTKTASAPS